jgi:hypothetical protein
MTGITLRLTETRGSRVWPAFAHASRKSSICSAAGPRDRGAEERRLLARLVVIDRIAEGLGTVPRRLGRAPADPELESAVGEQIGCRCGLGHVERVLIAHVDHAGADLDAAGLDADRREEREGRGELAGEVVDADERPVDPDLLGGDCELDRLAKRVATRVGQSAARMPGAERKETDPLWIRHRSAIPTWLTAQVFRGGL